jgi:hypothetical protein
MLFILKISSGRGRWPIPNPGILKGLSATLPILAIKKIIN